MENRKGFTLTEILIVMVVAGILLALILPNTLRAIERGNVTALRNDVNSIDTALFMCFSETRDWAECGTLEDLTDGDKPYLQDIPNNPFVENGYGVLEVGVSGCRACVVGGDYPQDIEDDLESGVIPEC